MSVSGSVYASIKYKSLDASTSISQVTAHSGKMKFLIFLALLLFIEACYGKAIAVDGWGTQDETVELDIPLDILRRMKPSRFVPINSVMFFKSHEPCEEGFQRDVMGVCREVWE